MHVSGYACRKPAILMPEGRGRSHLERMRRFGSVSGITRRWDPSLGGRKRDFVVRALHQHGRNPLRAWGYCFQPSAILAVYEYKSILTRP